MEQESLEFAVTVSGTYWSRKPQFSIWLDNHVVIQTAISSELPQTHKFTHTLDEGEHTLSIRLENKTDSDTLIVDGNVDKDMLLNIDDITIDDISLAELLWSQSTFLLDKPHEYQGKEITQLDNCVNLGWNGSYTLKFSSPYYIWLLEKL
jgi:hypothetical protein